MAIPATIVYFGQDPTTIILQSNSNFDGSATTGTPVLAPALYTFPAQALGGLYNFHGLVGTQEAITVRSITYSGGGTLTINRVLSTAVGAPVVIVGTIAVAGDLVFQFGDLTLPPGENLKFVSVGGTNPVIAITAKLARNGGAI